MTNFEELKLRGLVKDVAGEDLEDKINNDSLTFYWGTDPTADSLHLGHYSSLITAKRLMKMGHKPILLVGGATGLIGDPRPTAERALISKEEVLKNIEGLSKQVGDILEGKAKIVNNYDWLKDVNLLDFLRDFGKYVNVSYMLNKDIIKRRLESGITYAEFTYTLLQGYDYYYLNQTENCTLQAAGSDQWGNITTGVDLIKKITGKDVYAFTMPLILDATGKKFGKSEGNALWLDENKTSSYELYQYLINTDDVMVEDYLKVFTFLTLDEIADVMEKHGEHPEDRLAQKTLAREIITDLHGKESYERALKISESLFNGNIKELTKDEIKKALKDVPSFEFKEGSTLGDVLTENGVCSSKRELREFLNAGSITVNGDKVSDENMVLNKSILLKDEIIVVRRGKKKYYVGNVK